MVANVSANVPANVSANVPATVDLFALPESQAAKSGEQFLRCHLVPDTSILLPIAQLTEVLTIPLGQITPIPGMPVWVMGVYNWRGEVLWMVDLGYLIGLLPWYQQDSNASVYNAVVLQSNPTRSSSRETGNQLMGLVVTQVQDIEWCNPDDIQSPPGAAITPELAPFLRGYWLKSPQEMLTCLDAKAIFAAMPQ